MTRPDDFGQMPTGEFARLQDLSEQLEQKATELNSLTERVTAAEQRLKTRSVAGSETGNAALVERIQRLEAENRRLKQGKAAAKATTTADNGSGEEEN